MKISLVGPAYTLNSVVAAAQTCINWYPETIQAGNEPRTQVLFGRPGLKFFAQLTPAKIRCLWGSGGRLFAIHGGNETEIHQNGSQTTQPGTVAQGTGSPDPAQIFSNGNQLMIVSGGLVYCDNGAGPVQVLMAMTGTASATGTNNEVTWLTGPLFTAAMTGKTLRFDGNIYTITGVISTGPSAFQVMLVSPNPPAPRPQGIESANIIRGTPQLRYRLAIVTDLQWAKIRLQDIASTIPEALYNDRAYPLSTLYLYGQPMPGDELELFVWTLVPQFQTLTDAVLLPPGYEDALVLNLACRLAPHFQRQLDPLLLQQARESLMRLESINAPQPIADTSALCSGYGNNRYNIYSDQFRH